MRLSLSLFVVVTALSGCKPRSYNGAQTKAAAALGPLPDAVLDLSGYPETAAAKERYAKAVAEFRAAYGESDAAYDVVSLRSNRFISRKAWDRGKEATNYNPITATDKYNYDHNPDRTCRMPDLEGKLTNVWMAFERAAAYADEVVKAGVAGKPIPWAPGYKRLSHIQNWFSTKATPAEKAAFQAGQSATFDLNVLLSIHAANGEGATQDEDPCGKIAQVKVCDGHAYSPFFHPDPRPLPCRFASDWYPSASAWSVMLGDEMRQMGQHVVPLPEWKKRDAYLAPEYKDKGWSSCAQAGELENALQYSAEAKSQDWPGLKGKLPQFTTEAMQRGPAYLEEQGRQQNLAGFALYASVEQTYKDLANYRLKPGLLDTTRPECRPCGLKKNATGYEWNMDKRGVCPRACLSPEVQNVLMNERVPGAGRATDILRHYFEPDTSEPDYPSIAALMGRHFSALTARGRPPRDPVALAAHLQQWFVAMHPFIDGDGRTSRYLMEIALHSAGLPFPVLDDFWSDSDLSVRDYTALIREGIDRHTGALKACAAYVSCLKSSNPGFDVGTLGSIPASSETCKDKLRFTYGSGKTDAGLHPADCNTRWDRNPETAKYSQCR